MTLFPLEEPSMLEQDRNHTKRKILTVSDFTYLAWSCCNNAFNQEEGGEDGCKRCKYCKKTVVDSDPRHTDNVNHIFSSAALWGILASMGTLVGSQLNASCPRLQKHGDSQASLAFGSFLDAINPVIDPEVTDQIANRGRSMEGEESRRTRLKTEDVKRRLVKDGSEKRKQDDDDEDDETDEDFHPSVGDMAIHDELVVSPEEGPRIHPMSMSFETGNLVNVLSHISLSGFSLHTRGMEFKSDENLKDTKGEINVLSDRVKYKCEEEAQRVLREQQQQDVVQKTTTTRITRSEWHVRQESKAAQH
ncbi:hypothetical protein Pcinc_008561 [Petrolisthes cinctipes]|uniref:Uncharacterized protein n=1 Tax=Petrolisthes cinctipes TaxID=88211 RepID=A0AAE1G902_PETCI|nr:hypothetical protein Pcinc_008561 [Petrolisthes cinctipes]